MFQGKSGQVKAIQPMMLLTFSSNLPTMERHGVKLDLVGPLLTAGLPNWAACGLSVDRNSPAAQRTLYITMDGDVFRSTDDGATFSRVLTSTVSRTAVDHFNSNYVYAGGDAGLFRSTDGG